jgi:hypothetical protein
MYLFVSYGSHNKQRLFPQTESTGWALLWRRNVFPVRYGLNLCILVGRNSVFLIYRDRPNSSKRYFVDCMTVTSDLEL